MLRLKVHRNRRNGQAFVVLPKKKMGEIPDFIVVRKPRKRGGR